MRRGRKPKLQTATPAILRHFERIGTRVYSELDLKKIVAETRGEWNLSMTTGLNDVIALLSDKGALRQFRIRPTDAHPAARVFVRYAWGRVSPFKLGLSMFKASYLSHGTAVFLHGLNDQIPRRAIYINHEQAPKPPTDKASLSQGSVDRAFGRPQRLSTLRYQYDDDNSFLVLNGKNTGRLEVGSLTYESEDLAVTKIERTLIDIAVRPAYAGGVYQVLEAYRGARDKISGRVLQATLAKLNYAYPYHQAIGFYMHRAGFSSQTYERLKSFGMALDFYLSHNIKDKDYSPEWRLFYPKGL